MGNRPGMGPRTGRRQNETVPQASHRAHKERYVQKVILHSRRAMCGNENGLLRDAEARVTSALEPHSMEHVHRAEEVQRPR